MGTGDMTRFVSSAAALLLVAVAATAADGAFAADDSADLQALLDKGGEVRFPAGEFMVGKTLVVRPGTHLVCEKGFRARLKDGANCAILANADEKTNLVSDISVEGGLWDGNNVHQDRSKYSAAGFTPPLRYGAKRYGQLIVFSGVRGLRLKGLTVKDPQGFSIQLTDVEDFAVEDITFDCNDKTINEDGVHVNGFARHGRIRGIRGHTNDDLVALNSDEGDFRTDDCTIEDIVIEDLDGGERGYTGVRLLSRHARVRDVTIRNVRGKFQFNVVSFTHWAGKGNEPGMGHFDSIVIEDVTATSCRKEPGGHGGLIWFQEGVQDVGTVTIRRLRREEGPEYRNQTHTIDIGADVVIRELTLEDVTQDLPDGRPLVRKDASARVSLKERGALPQLVGDGVADDTAAIQARLDAGAGCVRLPPPAKEYVISRPLLIGSDTELKLDRATRIRLAPDSNCPMIANRHPVEGDSRITITGGVWDFDNMRQFPSPWCLGHVGKPYAVTKTLPEKKAGADYKGWGMYFERVEGFRLSGVTLRNPTTFGCCLVRVTHFDVADVTFDYETFNPVRACMDGIHLDGGCRFGRIANLRGACWDDTVALNSNDDHGGPATSEGEPITDIVIDGIRAEGSHSAVRLLSTGGEIRNITIRNVHGTFYRYAVGLTHFFRWDPSKPRGRMDNVTIEDCSFGKCETPAHFPGTNPPAPLISVEEKLDVGTLRVVNVSRKGTLLDEVPTLLVEPQAVISTLVIRGGIQSDRPDCKTPFFENRGDLTAK